LNRGFCWARRGGERQALSMVGIIAARISRRQRD
jgi:hypothetical protein